MRCAKLFDIDPGAVKWRNSRNAERGTPYPVSLLQYSLSGGMTAKPDGKSKEKPNRSVIPHWESPSKGTYMRSSSVHLRLAEISSGRRNESKGHFRPKCAGSHRPTTRRIHSVESSKLGSLECGQFYATRGSFRVVNAHLSVLSFPSLRGLVRDNYA